MFYSLYMVSAKFEEILIYLFEHPKVFAHEVGTHIFLLHSASLTQSRLCATQGKVSRICHADWLTTEKFLPLLCRILSCVNPRASSSSSATILHNRQVMRLMTHFPCITPSLWDFSRLVQSKGVLMLKVLLGGC